MQKNYSAIEIAELLEVNIETVRRWIRKDALAAQLSSRKEGNVITEEALQQFFRENPKYKARARRNGYVGASPVKIRICEGASSDISAGTVWVNGGKSGTLNSRSLFAEAMAQQVQINPPAYPTVKAKSGGLAGLETRELVALVDTKQREINYLKRKLRSAGAKPRKTALKKK